MPAPASLLSVTDALQLYQAGQPAQAATVLRRLLKQQPDQDQALGMLGMIEAELGHDDRAVNLFRKCIKLNPAHPEWPIELGKCLTRLGQLDAATSALGQALALQPLSLEAWLCLGNVQLRQDRVDDAVASFERAVTVAPTQAKAHFNLAVALLESHRPDRAVPVLRQALSLQPRYATAHNNLGVALLELGEFRDAEAHFHQALAQDASLADAALNLHGLALDQGDLAAALTWLERCVQWAPQHPTYRFHLGLLHQQLGNTHAAGQAWALRSTDPTWKANLASWRYLSAQSPQPRLLGSAGRLFALALQQARPDGLVLEFGVYHGNSIRQLARLVDQPIHGFDSFAGIPEAWHDERAGSYSTGGQLPQVPAHVQLHAGWFSDTLPAFLAAHAGQPVRFANIDCDLYSSTVTVLDALAPHLVAGSVLVFDEFISNPTWQQDEYKAFHEAARRHGWRHEVLAYSFLTKQVAIRLS